MQVPRTQEPGIIHVAGGVRAAGICPHMAPKNHATEKKQHQFAREQCPPSNNFRVLQRPKKEPTGAMDRLRRHICNWSRRDSGTATKQSESCRRSMIWTQGSIHAAAGEAGYGERIARSFQIGRISLMIQF